MGALEVLMDSLGVSYRPVDGNQSVLCPFHEDKSPSASLRLSEGLFNCFVCGVGGDVIEILKQTEGLSFVDAKRRAEELAGESDGQVSRRSPGERGDSLLPRKSGHRPGRRGWTSPWARHQP